MAKVEVLPALRKLDAPEVTASVRQTTSPPAAWAAQMEATSGVKVTRGSSGPPKGLIIDVAQALGVKLASAPDARLVENSRYGLLPRIGVDGARPFEVYSRAVGLDAGVRTGSPRVALVVGGFGVNADNVGSAIAQLPGAITLGFAPAGAAVEQQAAKAREAGHETVLQARLEKSPEAAGDLESHITSASEVDLDSLRWQMGRFTGYVAVINDPGDRSVADRRTMSPILQEIANRGLGYLDDGAPSRSVTLDLAGSLAMPSALADIVIDASATPEAMEAALSRLVELARQRGSAIGVASATPASISRLARWGDELETKGVALVPLSALMSGWTRPSAHESLRP
ncbi:MAG TPA: divergent polysaccharide deacetylase family protein [Roseiarcus sp.]